MNRKTETELEHPMEKLLSDLKAVMHDGEELLRAGGHELSERGADARAQLSAALDSAKDLGRKLEKRALNGAKATDRIIRENPYQSLGIAFGLGVLIGVLVNRRNS